MSMNGNSPGGSRLIGGLTTIGGRAAAVGIRPFTGVIGAAAGAGADLERRALDRLIESGELERVLDNVRLQALAGQVLDSRGMGRLVDMFFDSGLFDQFVDRLLSSEGLWRLVDEICASPAITAAISQQGLGFADQVGTEVRTRSRRADVWLERVARRLTGQDESGRGDPTADEATGPASPELS